MQPPSDEAGGEAVGRSLCLSSRRSAHAAPEMSSSGRMRFRSQRWLVYTEARLYEIPAVYIRHENAPYLPKILSFSGGQLDADGSEDSFCCRKLRHAAFRGDCEPVIGSLEKLAFDVRAGRSNLVGVCNEFHPASPEEQQGLEDPRLQELPWEPAPESEVLWCVQFVVDPNITGFETFLGCGFLFPLPMQQRLLDALNNLLWKPLPCHLPYPGWTSALAVLGRPTASVFDPSRWPLALPVNELTYYEGLFAMCIRPVKCVNGEPVTTSFRVESDDKCTCSATIATVDPQENDYGRPERMRASWQLSSPSLLRFDTPDEIIDLIVDRAARKSIANDALDWSVHLQLRAVSKRCRATVDTMTESLAVSLFEGLKPMVPREVRTPWEHVKALREIALNANLHVVDIIRHACRIDKWTVARIRRECVER